MSKLPKPPSEGEELFALNCQVLGLSYEPEYKFCPGRKFRADFYIQPDLLVEIEGGTWIAGRHSRGSGMEKDMEKYNVATKLGFRLLRYTTGMVKRGDALEDLQVICK